jgi:hypothetical protein
MIRFLNSSPQETLISRWTGQIPTTILNRHRIGTKISSSLELELTETNNTTTGTRTENLTLNTMRRKFSSRLRFRLPFQKQLNKLFKIRM